MKKYSIDTTQTAASEQTVFNIPFLNENSTLYLNNELQELGTEWYINDEGYAEFLIPTEEGDELNSVSLSESQRNMTVLSYGRKDKSNALFQRFSSDKRLDTANVFTVNINIKNEDFKWTFTSKLEPLFSSVKSIRNDIGEFISDFSDERIQGNLYSNSKELVELIQELAEDGTENVTITENPDGSYTSSDRAVVNWVRYKTDIDLIYAKYFGISANYGSVKKSIGDIDIERSTKLPYIDQLLGRLRVQYEEADAQIRGINTVASGVKAIDQYTYDNWARETTW